MEQFLVFIHEIRNSFIHTCKQRTKAKDSKGFVMKKNLTPSKLQFYKEFKKIIRPKENGPKIPDRKLQM